MFSLLGESLLPNWVVNSFPVIKFIVLILIVLAAIALTILVLLQSSDDNNTTNSITGIKDTYYSQNKGATREGRFKKLTVALAIFIAVAVIIFFVLTEIYPNSLWS